MDYFLHLVNETGLPRWDAEKIVSAVSWGGNAFVIVSIISTVASGGTLAGLEAGADVLVWKIKRYLTQHAWTWVVAW